MSSLVCLSLLILSNLVPGSVAQAPGENDWTQMAPTVAPSPRSAASMAYDAQSDRVILFGGNSAADDPTVFSDETWAYDYNADAWTLRNPAVRPTGRGSAGMAYDAKSDRIILFGGCTSGFPWEGTPAVTDETWAYHYDSDSWTKMSPTQGPSARCSPSMAYDAQSDRVILHGGYASDSLGDTWAYDHNSDTWTPVTPVVRPRTGDSSAMAYDAESDRIILFGGAWGGLTVPVPHGDNNETWAYNHEAGEWVDMRPTPAPPRRWTAKAAYVASADRVVLFGGSSGLALPGAPWDDTWTYDFNANRWTDMNSPAPPSARCCHAVAYDSESDRVILFGGAVPISPSSQQPNDETWAYGYRPNVPSPPTNPQAAAGNAKIELSWGPPRTDAGAPVLGYHVYRGTSPTGLTRIAELVPVLSYLDEGVSNSITYYYRVSSLNSAGESSLSRVIQSTPADTIPPVISISSPSEDDALLSTSVTVAGNASDDGAIAQVELSTDGVNWEVATGKTTWSGTLDLVVGENTIFARATDMAGHTATDTVNVTVSTFPGGGQTPIDPLLIASVSLVAGAAVVAVLLLLRRRRSG